MPDDDKTTLNVTLPADLKQRLIDAADERMMNVSVLAARAIRDLLDDLVPVDELVLVRGRNVRAEAAERATITGGSGGPD